ncbi:hypothetical protein GWI34_08870 [Actinomadura sp. DSM 109109]|nr:hypothetical protein [Actinomadura lepetitiana]
MGEEAPAGLGRAGRDRGRDRRRRHRRSGLHRLPRPPVLPRGNRRHLPRLLREPVHRGAVFGAGFGVLGYAVSAWAGLHTIGAKKIVLRLTGGAVVAGLAVSVAFVAMAASGAPVAGAVDPFGVFTVDTLLNILCSYAAGIAIGAARTRD